MQLELFSPKTRQWLRFFIAGAANTAATYALYLALHQIAPYQIAYLMAYIAGIILAYFLNTLYVFKERTSWKKFFAYPSIYFIQYIAAAGILWVLVNLLHTSQKIAPLYTAVLCIPLGFALNKLLITKKPTKTQSNSY